ncbi:MAG: peptide chain release factor N(5)-glutamine methyltransferase [Acidobacteria bacterium]|nr:peptide chain release factor N(5)-glutamine methyltransferase [Acidobacteriota bacterium]MBI3421492.1 peptide chain release factor N(5)-glutamine methyltransferase [Acidobacteriota bacterium]
MTIAEVLKEASAALRAAAVPNDLLDAQTLLAHALTCDRTHLIVHFNQQLTDEQQTSFTALIARRAAGEPLQYITGQQEFFGLPFLVTPAVLIPRPETEILVEEVIRLAQLHNWTNPVIVDAGTGSGCIAVTLARELEGAQVIATDISTTALAVARRNAALNGVAERVQFVQSDWLDAVPAEPLADFIVSNPPYVAAHEMPTLQREVREWEPALALTDQGDGLGCYRRLLADAPARLKPGGYFLCELGYTQSAAVSALADQTIWTEPQMLDDLQGIPRTLVLRRR